MKLTRGVLLSANAAWFRQFRSPNLFRNFSASPLQDIDYGNNSNSSESVGDFEKGFFGNQSSPTFSSLFQKLGKAEKAHDRSGMGFPFNTGSRPGFMGGLDENSDTTIDGMEQKLMKAATFFEYDADEVSKDDYSFRRDINFSSGSTYETKDLNLDNPGVHRPMKRKEYQTTTKEVLRKADFRNVRFLANFITEAGIIKKRSMSGISAKAQRKIAREIKTARAFGLMPFTSMGTKHFIFGNTMEAQDVDFEYDVDTPRSFVEE